MLSRPLNNSRQSRTFRRYYLPYPDVQIGVQLIPRKADYKRVVYWGTYDSYRPRTQILIKGLRRHQLEVIECHTNIWSNWPDKSQIGFGDKLRVLLRALVSYPILILRYCSTPGHDLVLLGYLGHFDLLVIYPFAKIRRRKIVWDAVISLYDTIVFDRKSINARSFVAYLLYRVEWLCCNLADVILTPSKARASLFLKYFSVSSDKFLSVPIGADPDVFVRAQPVKSDSSKTTVRVLFYGQFVPLHGVVTIVEAARILERDDVEWTLIGGGQDESKIKTMLELKPLPKVKWIPWTPYEHLPNWIHESDICLGIFGDSLKAKSSLPNKLFQVLAMGAPLITSDSSAIRELLSTDMKGVYLVPPNNPQAIVAAIQKFRTDREELQSHDLHADVVARLKPETLAERLLERAL